MTEKKELNEEALKEVAGGGSGVTENGVFGQTYDTPKANRYYSYFDKIERQDNIFYVYEVSGNYVSGCLETLYVNSRHEWRTKFIINDTYTTIERFKKDHPYELNIRP